MFILLTALLVACSPNILNIVANAAQGECVQASEYGSLESQAIAAFPMIAKNPTTAPYCVSITIQNNNAVNVGGTNMQVTSPGLIITGLPNESNENGNPATPFSMIDPVASNVPLNTANQTQVTGNMALFDPNNCVTTTGVNTITLQSGQSCKFYLQIVGESYPPNTYPMTVAYNYYNGNTTYALYTNINQRVNLYGGTESGLFTVTSSSPTAASQWSNPGFNIPSNAIKSVIADIFGNLYFATTNLVYIYNGMTLTQLGSNFTTNVTALTIDVNGNLYAGTSGSGVYIYDTGATPNAWVSFTDTSGNLTSSSIISAISSTGFIPGETIAQNLYVTTANKAFACSIMPSQTVATSCAFSDISTIASAPSLFNFNSIDSDNFGNLYIGSESSAYTFIESSNSWQNLTFPNTVITGNIAGIYNQANSSVMRTYVGVINATTAESATLFYCNVENSCAAVISSTPNTLAGNAYAVTTDGAGDVFVGGSTLNSLDFNDPLLAVTGAYLYFTASGGTWQPVNNGSMGQNNRVNSVVVASSLTVY